MFPERPALFLITGPTGSGENLWGQDCSLLHDEGVEESMVRIPRKPISGCARMPITHSAHADQPRSVATLVVAW